MVVKIVGVMSQNFTLDNGYHFEGKKVHAVDMDKVHENLKGHEVVTFKLPATRSDLIVPDVGAEYRVFFDQKGNVDFITPTK